MRTTTKPGSPGQASRAPIVGLIGVDTVARALDINQRTLTRHVASGRLPGIPIGRLIRFDPVELARAMSGGDPDRATRLEQMFREEAVADASYRQEAAADASYHTTPPAHVERGRA